MPFETSAKQWTVELLVEELETAEGPVWADDGRLFFTEIFAHKVHAYDVETAKLSTIREKSGGANGMALDAQGRLLMCEMLDKRVTRLEEDGRVSALWEANHEGRGGPNDIVVDVAGIAYFTMPKYGTVYRVSSGGTVEPFIEHLSGINGVMLSRDELTLYVTEYRNRKVRAFHIDPTSGNAGPGKLFAEIVTDGEGHGADGMAIDQEDRLYVCCLNGVWIYDATGKEVDFISLPGEKVTNCAFAGTDFDTLYITTQSGLYRASR